MSAVYFPQKKSYHSAAQVPPLLFIQMMTLWTIFFFLQYSSLRLATRLFATPTHVDRSCFLFSSLSTRVSVRKLHQYPLLCAPTFVWQRVAAVALRSNRSISAFVREVGYRLDASLNVVFSNPFVLSWYHLKSSYRKVPVSAFNHSGHRKVTWKCGGYRGDHTAEMCMLARDNMLGVACLLWRGRSRVNKWTPTPSKRYLLVN